MTQQTTQNWNAPKEQVTDKLSDTSDYVLIGRKRDGQSFVMSSGDQTLAQDLLHTANIGQKEGAGFGG